MVGGGLLLAAPSPRLTGLPVAANVTAASAAAACALLIIFALVRKSEKGRIAP
jgi:hypothetical protein